MNELMGYSEAEQANLLALVGVDVSSATQVHDTFARCVWNSIVEPGDSDLGELIANEGPEGALTQLLEASLPKPFAEAETRWQARLHAHAVEDAVRGAAAVGAKLLTPETPCWPTALSDLDAHQPLVLWCRGDISALDTLSKSVSVVGARASTGYGEHVTYELVSGLVDRGFTIISGAAYGIDGVAHRTALASGGRTIALMAGGIDRFYPSGHDTLLRNIEQTGAVLAELPCGTAPTRWRFLQRNRLIAAMSPVTVVVEAGWRSGSLNTAHHAASLGRVLTAIPGPVTSPSSAGCHRLMREAAALCVTSAQDVAQLIACDDEFKIFSAEEQCVLDALSRRTARSITELEQRTGLGIRQLRAALAELDMQELVKSGGSGWLRC